MLILNPHNGGAFQLTATLKNSRGEMIAAPQEETLTLDPVKKGEGGFVAAAFFDVPINTEGRHTFSLAANGKEVYLVDFLVLSPSKEFYPG